MIQAPSGQASDLTAEPLVILLSLSNGRAHSMLRRIRKDARSCYSEEIRPSSCLRFGLPLWSVDDLLWIRWLEQPWVSSAASGQSMMDTTSEIKAFRRPCSLKPPELSSDDTRSPVYLPRGLVARLLRGPKLTHFPLLSVGSGRAISRFLVRSLPSSRCSW